MNCPICNYTEIKIDTQNCPNCSSDLSLINNIKQLSNNTNKNKNIFIFIFSILITIILILLFYVFNNSAKSNEADTPIANNYTETELIKKNTETPSDKYVLNKDTVSELEKTTENNTINEGISVGHKEQTYIVQENDNLWMIAEKFYGDGYQFKKIAEDNKLKKPYALRVGKTLIINK